jgi:histidine triad (HIT) family protein
MSHDAPMPTARADRCVFCAIVAGDEPAEVVFDDTAALAFLDRRPVFPGHVLIVPRDHVQTLADLPVDQVAPLFQRVQLITAAVESALAADGSFVAMNNRVSQSVPHLHVHVVPRRRGDGLRGFFWPRRKYAAGEAEAVADQIRVALAPPVSQ